MAAQRNSSIDSGLLSSDVTSYNREQTALKPVFSSSVNNSNMSQNNQPPISRRNTGPSQQRPRSAESAYIRRKSFHEAPSGGTIHPKEDSDSDPGIVPDVTKLLLGNRHRRSKASPATYSIHINTLYVYQQPTIPVENPMYQQLPVDRNDESPPSPCSKPAGYQYVWPTTRPEDFRHPQQHHDSTYVHRSRPTSLNLSSRTELPRPMYATSSKGHDTYTKLHDEGMSHLKLSSPTLSEGEEMEILIKGKSGKARRYKLHPIIEQSQDQDAYVMNASGGEKVVIQGLTINDHDEAFSESGSIIYPESSSASTVTSGTPSGVAINTTVGDCKVTVNQTFQSTDNELGINCTNQPEIRTSLSANDIMLGGAPPRNHPYHTESSPAVNQHSIMQAKSMNDPTYFDFEVTHGSNLTESGERQHQVFSGNMSRSVPNIVLSSRIDTCYECRSGRRGGIFSSKQKSRRSCTLEGFHYITDEHEISFMKEILDQKGKLGNWFITPTTNQPGYDSCLYVKTQREVTSFPVAMNKKKKFFLDYNIKKSFPCLCKLTEFYKLNHLPLINVNLGQVLPNDAIPDMSFGADGSGTLMEQYAGIQM